METDFRASIRKAYAGICREIIEKGSICHDLEKKIEDISKALADCNETLAAAAEDKKRAEQKLAVANELLSESDGSRLLFEDMDLTGLFCMFETMTGYKALKVAELLGVSESGYRNWRNGTNNELPYKRYWNRFAEVIERETEGLISIDAFMHSIGVTEMKRAAAGQKSIEDEPDDLIDSPDEDSALFGQIIGAANGTSANSEEVF